MTNPSNRYEDLRPVEHEKSAEVTDTELNDELERGDVDEAELKDGRIRHDESDSSEPPVEES